MLDGLFWFSDEMFWGHVDYFHGFDDASAVEPGRRIWA